MKNPASAFDPRNFAKVLTLLSFYFAVFLANSVDLQGQSLSDLKQKVTTQSDSVKLQTYIQIIRKHIANNDTVKKYAKHGLDESISQSNVDYQGQFLMFLTICSHNQGYFDEALKFGREAISKFDESENQLWAAGVSRQVGQIFIDMLLYDSAMHYCIKALDYHSTIEVNPGTLEAMSSIAEIHQFNSNSEQAINWLKRMLGLAVANDFKYYISSANFQLGKVYDQLEVYDSAIHFKKLALENTSSLKSNNLVDIIGSLGESFSKYGNLDSAKRYVRKFYSMSRNQEQLYRAEHKKAASAVALGTILLEEGDYNGARSKLLEAVTISKKISFKKKLYEAYWGLYRIANNEDFHKTALEYYLKFSELRSEEINEENQKNIQRLNFEFETKQKAQEISLLKIESDLKDAEIDQTRSTLYWVVAIVILIVLFCFLLINRIRLKQRAQLSEARVESQKNRFKAVIDAEEKERKRIAQELHDSLGQILSTARLSISSLDEEEQNKSVQHSLKLLDAAVDETRTISHNMMPNALVSIGLEAALRDLVRNINQAGTINAEIEMDQLPKMEESTSVTIYRIVQETINNALKYSDATTIKVQLLVKNGMILSISDDGKGFDASEIEKSEGIGWKNIYSRAGLLNGNVSVFSKLGEGTTVKITLPFNESSKATAS